ncbi:flavin reductase family protein [Nocardioides sp.]|uniref:flavin reductase family protein n=1 Tax=Nocardioides sp. TaxID=35761 RepID=UPI002CCD2A4F|nr:flavin reductase family protein [Nocardioides sp.]HSX68939.1 flavin reductase family protein [Nocardioides sp.]
MTIHSSHPFAMPEDAARRFRGRLGGTVSLWTSGAGPARAGLTVSSLMVATGDPAYVVGLVDPDSELFDALETTGRGVVQLLQWRHRELADMFAGVTPAPGGPFRQAAFEETEWGPRLADATSWVGVAVESATELGWSMQVTCRIEHVVLGDEPEPLVHRRGRYVQR